MIIDLTHTLKNNITFYPGTLEPLFEQENTIDKDGFAELKLTMCTHTGTHIDAPCHILPNTKSLSDFPIEKFIGNGISINCSRINSITLDFLKPMENEIKEVEFILFYTGWHKKWNTPAYFDEFPVLTQQAVEWLLKFKLKAIGFDTISADKTTDLHLPNHNLLLKNEVLIIENLKNLDQLIDHEFEFNCIPLKIDNTDGSPVRAFARNVKIK
ncbi:MAG: cyclase family protein [Bacteroidales bacterium]